MDFQAALAQVDALGLPHDQYAIFGSGPLAVRHLRPTGDIDLIVLPDLWGALAVRYPPTTKAGYGPVIALGDLEIWNDWHPAVNDLPALIAEAEEIAGHPFVRLAAVRTWKIAAGSPRDLADVALIDSYLAGGGT